jgi:hypothetical protein
VVAVGVTVIEAPAPSEVPPHEPEYQSHVAPVPRLPPVIPRVVVDPVHIGEVEVAEEAIIDKSLTVNKTFPQLEKVAPSSCLTKYVVETVGVTATLFPVPNKVPPHETVYQYH